MAVITSSVAMIIFVAVEITYKINMSEKSCWYSLKNVVNCSNGGIQYKLSSLLYILYLTESKWHASKLKSLIVAMIIFVAAKITYKINMSEKSCWYSLKNVVNCSNGGIKYKLGSLLYISYLTEIKWYASKFKSLITFN